MKKTINIFILIAFVFLLFGCSKKTKEYTVIWENYDGVVLEKDNKVKHGEMPVYDGETPIKETDNGDVFVFADWDKEISVVKKDITYKATFDLLYSRNNKDIEFGVYPQTKVDDESLISSLNTEAGTLPTSLDSSTWISYEYYISGSNDVDFMWYKDLNHNNEKYRGVYFTSYLPQSTYDESIRKSSEQYKNKYFTSSVYWFKFEPIKWKILNENGGKALILSEMIIDSREYYTKSNERNIDNKTVYPIDWEYSTIRSWLNSNFYNTAFGSLEKQIISATELDNKTTSSQGAAHPYGSSQNNTVDKIFLLSYQDLLNINYGFSSNSGPAESREKKATEYSKVQGTKCSSEIDASGIWYTRSAAHGWDINLSSCGSDGDISYAPSCFLTYNGIVPALTITIS